MPELIVTRENDEFFVENEAHHVVAGPFDSADAAWASAEKTAHQMSGGKAVYTIAETELPDDPRPRAGWVW